jgi:sporulation protein YlmC with PRC-barrel domain
MKYPLYIVGTAAILCLGAAPTGVFADSSGAQRSDQNAQISLGGAKSSVSGEITKIQNEYYFIKDKESGDEVRLLVNRDTNLDCSKMSGSESARDQEGIGKSQFNKSEPLAESSGRQKEQGQKQDETAVGSGFQMGSCAFKTGDKVKAEVDDNGRVTTLKFLSKDDPQMARSIGESAGTGELAKPGQQDKQGQLDMTGAHGYPPKEYAILPVPMGEFKVAGRDSLLHSPVKDQDGKTLGKIESLIMDSKTGQIEYAVISLQDSANALQAVPWGQFAMKRDDKDNHLMLNTKKYQLDANVTQKDRSPELQKLMKDMQQAKAPADLQEEHGQKETTSASQGSGSGMDRRMQAMRDVKGDIIRGRVTKIDGETLMVKEKSGKEINIHVDGKTMKGAVNLKDDAFKIGDRVEAYVTPDGHAFSISLMQFQGGIPGDPDAGG